MRPLSWAWCFVWEHAGDRVHPATKHSSQVETAIAGCFCRLDRPLLCPKLHHDVRRPGGFASPLPYSPSPPASSYAHELRAQVVAPLLNFKQASRMNVCLCPAGVSV
ncbi:hypothetical protein BKA80DRAFT_345497 [Phyllosticta citrichinensis]